MIFEVRGKKKKLDIFEQRQRGLCCYYFLPASYFLFHQKPAFGRGCPFRDNWQSRQLSSLFCEAVHLCVEVGTSGLSPRACTSRRCMSSAPGADV